MKHDIQAWLVPASKYDFSLVVGTISDTITKYKADGVAQAFNCAEIKPEESTFSEINREMLASIETIYLNADRDLAFKKDDIIILPFGRYKVTATNNARERIIKNGFMVVNTTIDIVAVKQK